MRCLKPFVSGRVAFGCGQCLPCRVNRRRVWMHRIMLEAMCHEASSFVTLTYADAPYSLDPGHLRDWLKRFRWHIRPAKIRYFCVGEYGDVGDRPHFHGAIFGFPPCQFWPIKNGECQCRSCSVVRSTWGFGHVMCGTLTVKSAGYIAKYVVKKMTSERDLRLSEGQFPEFARMSLRPGIGADALWDVASAMMRYGQLGLPSRLAHGSKKLPLGRYLRIKLGERLGYTEEERARLSDEALSRLYEEMSLVWRLAVSGKVIAEDGESIVSPSKLIGEINKPYARQLEGRERLYVRRKL